MTSLELDEADSVPYLSTNVILSAISATRFAILPAMMAYADVAPCVGFSPATEAALFAAGAALCCAGRATPLTACLGAAFFMGARGAAGFFGVAPLTAGRCTCVAILSVLLPRKGFRPRAGRRTRFDRCARRMRRCWTSFLRPQRFTSGTRISGECVSGMIVKNIEQRCLVLARTAPQTSLQRLSDMTYRAPHSRPHRWLAWRLHEQG